MRKDNRKSFYTAICILLAFGLWTAAVHLVDVQAIGPRGSTVGFATINRFIHNLTGVNMLLYIITDWLGLVPVGFALGFALFGLVQLISRKRFLKVDYSILVLGGFYILVISAYILFEVFPVNYRPILINGYLEASYPSSTTMLVLTVMPTAAMQFNARIKKGIFKCCVQFAIAAFVAFMVIGRLISGVHWFSDIAGGALLSAGLVVMYHWVSILKVN